MNTKKICFVLFISSLCISFSTLGNSTKLSKQKNRDFNEIPPILSDIQVENYTVPGVPSSVPSNQILKIGILGDMNDITGNHSWKGAMLAAREINEAGGLLLSGTPNYIGLVAEDTDEAEAWIDPGKGVGAAIRMINRHEPHFVVGGFRYESLVAYLDVIMSQNIPFISIGCPVDDLCENVIDFYSHYKYFFRVTPMNTTAFGIELVTYIIELANYLSNTFQGNATKVKIIWEDLAWTTPLIYLLNYTLSYYNLSVTWTYLDITDPPIAMSYLLSSLDASGTQIAIPLVSGHLGPYLGYYYGIVKPRLLLAGLNYRAQSDIYWDDSSGGSQYEIVMQTAHNTTKTPLTKPFWNDFYEEFGEKPYYTAVGSYDAVRLLANATLETQSVDSDIIVSQLESHGISNPFIGASCKIAFSNSHDIIEGWPYGTSLFCQWQMDGNKVVLPSWNKIYPDSIATGSLSIPYWGINDLVEDNTHRLPGSFTLTSDADPIDTDGAFNLTWVPSDGVDYYSVYYSKNPITYVSKRYSTLVGKSVVSPHQITDLDTGDYYFIAVAYNGTGQKFSNYIHISVDIPGNGNGLKDISGYSIILILSIISLFGIVLIHKKYRKIN